MDDNDISTALEVLNTTELAPRTKPQDLRIQLQEETETREIIRDWMKYHLVEGVDYGGIHINKSCSNKYSCKDKSHYSKAFLKKPGQEKFMSLMHFIAFYKTDEQTKEMLGNQQGLICLICTICNFDGKPISLGRGAASMAEGFDFNKTIKMAQKRSRADAIMASGILADFFSFEEQDSGYIPPVVKENAPKSQNGCTCNTTNQYHSNSCPMKGAAIDSKITTPEIADEVAEEMIEPFSKIEDPEIVDLEEIPL